MMDSRNRVLQEYDQAVQTEAYQFESSIEDDSIEIEQPVKNNSSKTVTDAVQNRNKIDMFKPWFRTKVRVSNIHIHQKALSGTLSRQKSTQRRNQIQGFGSVDYDHFKNCLCERPEFQIKSMSFEVPLDRLYTLLNTCTTNEESPYCPIIIQINNPGLKSIYQGSYLIQVWSSTNRRLFEEVLAQPINLWSMIGDSLIYRIEQDVFAANSEHCEYKMVKFDQEKVVSVTRFKVHGDFTAIFATIWKDFLILVSHNQIRYLNLVDLKRQKLSTKAIEIDLQLGDFQTINVEKDCLVLEFQETEADSNGKLGCIAIFEQLSKGRLQFFQLIENAGMLLFESLKEHQSVEIQQRGYAILEYKVLRSFVKQINQYKHFGIVLHKDFTLDFYYDFQLVDRVASTEKNIFFKIDMSFRHLHFSSFDVETMTIKSHEVLCSWMHNIGTKTNHVVHNTQIEDLKMSLDDLNYDLNPDQTFSECFNNVIYSLLPKQSPLHKERENIESLLLEFKRNFYNKQQLICAKYVQLYNSFLVKDRNILISHGKFVSIFNLIEDQFLNEHIICDDQVRQIFRHRIQDQINIGVLVGTCQIKLVSIKGRDRIKVATVGQLDLQAVQYAQNQDAMVVLCRSTVQQKIERQQDSETMVHEPLNEEGNQCKLMAMMQGKLFEIPSDTLHEVDLSPYAICFQKGNREPFQRLVLDKNGKEQIHIDLSFSDDKPVILQTKKYSIDYEQDQFMYQTMTDQISYSGKLLQITKNSIIVMQQESDRLKVCSIIRCSPISKVAFFNEESWLYAIAQAKGNTDQTHDQNGLQVYGLKKLVTSQELVSSTLVSTIAKSLDFIDYDEQTATLAYFSDYHSLSLIPLPHRNVHKFFGMRKKRNYLAWLEYQGTFIAMDKKGVMTAWCNQTGKVLSQNNGAIDIKSFYSINEDMEIPDQINFEVYRANRDDRTWTQDNRVGAIARSLVVSCKPVEQGNTELSKIKRQKNSCFEKDRQVEFEKTKEISQFKVLEMSVLDASDQSTLQRGNSVSFAFKINPEDKTYTLKKQIVCKETLKFQFELPSRKEDRPHMYLSENAEKLMVLTKDSYQATIYNYGAKDKEMQVVWVPCCIFNRFPLLLRGQISVNTLVSPDLTRYIDYELSQNVVIIRDIETMKEIKTIPACMIQVQSGAKQQSMQQIAELGQRISFVDVNTIRVLTDDMLVIYIDISTSNEEEMIKSFVSVDNTAITFKDPNFFKEKLPLAQEDTLTRLIRRNSELKQFRLHEESLDRRIKRTSFQMNEIALKQIFAVDYSQDDSFLAEQSFTLLDWFMFSKLLDDPAQDFDILFSQGSQQLCFNVFPRLKTFLHLLTETFVKSNTLQSQLSKFFEETSIQGQRLTIPIIQDMNGDTPLDICLKQGHLNINMAAHLFKSIKDYPLLHSSQLLHKTVCNAITHNVPGIADFLDSRLVQSAFFQQGTHGVISTLKAEKEREICNQRVGLSEFSILSNRELLLQELFQVEGYKRQYQVCFFDIKNIVDNTEESDYFFEALANSNKLSLFSHLSIQIIIDKSWREHRKFFKFFFELPFIILTLAYFFWSVFCSVDDDNEDIFPSLEVKHKVGYYICCVMIVPLASYFTLQEFYQFVMNPRKYFNDFWNIIDLLGITFSMIPPAFYLRNIRFCNNQPSACEDHTPSKQWKQTTIAMYWFEAYGSLILMTKLFYYLRGYKSLSYLIHSIISIFVELKTFFFLFFISIIAFADAFYKASQFHRKYHQDETKTYYMNYQSAFLSTYYTLMASWGDLDNQETFLVFSIYILCSVFIYIVLLNLLIASVASVYGQIEETQELQHIRELANLIGDCRKFPLIRYFLKIKKQHTFMIVAREENQITQIE